MLRDLGGASTLKVKGSFWKEAAVLPHVVSETGASRGTITHGGFGHHQTHSILQKPVWNVLTRESLAVLETVRWRSGIARLHNGSVRHQP